MRKAAAILAVITEGLVLAKTVHALTTETEGALPKNKTQVFLLVGLAAFILAAMIFYKRRS